MAAELVFGHWDTKQHSDWQIMRQKRNKRVIGETLAELDANAGHLSQTSRENGVPVTTLLGWRDTYRNDPTVERYRRLKNEELADRFRVVSAMAIERLHSEIDSVKVDNLMVMAATGADKQLLLTGHSTDIEKVMERLIERLQTDLPDVPPEQLRSYLTETIEQKGTIG